MVVSNLLFQGLLYIADTTAKVKCDGSTTCDTGLPVVDSTSIQLQQVLQIVFGAIAAIAVLMIVISGLRFITAQGDPQGVAKARSTILYAVVGLVIAISAEIIVSFVLGKI